MCGTYLYTTLLVTHQRIFPPCATSPVHPPGCWLSGGSHRTSISVLVDQQLIFCVKKCRTTSLEPPNCVSHQVSLHHRVARGPPQAAVCLACPDHLLFPLKFSIFVSWNAG